MSKIELKMPKMGESISEATVLNWLKNEGDTVEQDETVLEVATDKVDSEVPSPCDGVIAKILVEPNTVVNIGDVIAIIEANGEAGAKKTAQKEVAATPSPEKKETNSTTTKKTERYSAADYKALSAGENDGFLSPLILNIAKKENLSIEEVLSINGSGEGGRIRKSDVVSYLKNRQYPLPSRPVQQVSAPKSNYKAPPISFVEGKDRIVEMDRMRQMIADHMVYSKHTSPHVTSYIEVDVTNIVEWRNRVKKEFQQKYNQKLTFTPIFVEAVAKAIQAYPMINVAVDDNKIVVRKDINIGMATALPSGNLIVPVVKNADEKNLLGLAKQVNHLAENARNNSLKPEEIKGSSFTISNVGTFGSLMGTPIINQPEVAILALGIIKKRPEVITMDKGDEIAIRSMMYLSLSFDHRVVDGFLGGSFLRKVGDELEAFDSNREI
ncbi:dihydrolipoamide acetyltransferase family protein [Aquimarina brevivitae]|uniref:Dihydrolipoamide acetyltransferase component of pyruvate dehydrogenase complex n=1 Tax=Aquimarina brevivitae TaxID=323412 RepID=A0A4Q7PH73_9FLAO|nr:dihydrolipoamide acetyltransferase family protein [Aquimarina brevivitae]RZS99884.1 2-oxoglutarate dehydrogenase E2 component (dihydrolipoamide succinyltransferase) [Aquimarina brevivitae]